MTHEEARAAVTVALMDIRQKLSLELVPVEVLWEALADKLTMAEYASVLRDLRERGHALVCDHTIELTEVGHLEAERINERLKEVQHRKDDHHDPGAPVVTGIGRSCEDRDHGVSNAACGPGREVPTGEERERWLRQIASHGLADAVEANGRIIPHFSLVACIAYRLVQSGSDSVGMDSSSCLRLLANGGLVALLGNHTRLLQRGRVAVSTILTARKLELVEEK